jgi:hypothetical protein
MAFRVDDVVLARLLAHLLSHDAQIFSCLSPRFFFLPDFRGLNVVQRDAPLEERPQEKVVDRVPDHPRRPPVIAGDPHDPVTDVGVQTHDVGVFVVHEIVRVLPLRRRARGVPFPLRRVDFGIIHPVPLTVNDVVTQLHVLDDLGACQ